MSFESVNPATGEAFESWEVMGEAAVQTVLDRAVAAQEAWRESNWGRRVGALRKAADLLEREQATHAQLMTREMGKPIAEAHAEVKKCAWLCRYYADNAESFLSPRPVETDYAASYVAFEPLGVVLAIMPWNFPYWQVFRFAIPALAAGNGGLLKHAPNVQGCAEAIEELLHEAGIPQDLFRVLRIEEGAVADVIADARTAAVTLTGSVRAGRAVARTAGAALKKTVLELGGSDPYVVLEDADLERTLDQCIKGRLLNSGQSCIAAKRYVVVDAVREEFTRRLLERMKQVRMGDPTDEDTDIGPLARPDLRENLHRQVAESIERGARCRLGGEVPEGPGSFYPVTVLTNVRPGMPAYEEELFGPVACVLPATDEADAIRIANDTEYGLGAAVFTTDRQRGERIAREALRAGSAFVNLFVRSDPRLPFGGIKASGYGRELSEFGIREFVNVKTVVVASSE
jgi:succinate-semialdehyde dehydrogenase/glutarate-semialdehyde dehydrogenase